MIQKMPHVETLPHLKRRVQAQQLRPVDVSSGDVALQGLTRKTAQRHESFAVLIHSVLVQLLHQRALLQDVEDLLHTSSLVHIAVVQVLHQLGSSVSELDHYPRPNVFFWNLMTLSSKPKLQGPPPIPVGFSHLRSEDGRVRAADLSFV